MSKDTRSTAAIQRPPEEWAQQAYPVSHKGPHNPGGRLHPSKWQHDAAAALHGWAEHAHHAGTSMKLTAEDYYLALVAASEPALLRVDKDKDGNDVRVLSSNYVPHPAALSPHARKGT